MRQAIRQIRETAMCTFTAPARAWTTFTMVLAIEITLLFVLVSLGFPI
jgi:hypothetical protein